MNHYYVYVREFQDYKGGAFTFYCPNGNTFSFSASKDRAASYARKMVDEFKNLDGFETEEAAETFANKLQRQYPEKVFFIAYI